MKRGDRRALMQRLSDLAEYEDGRGFANRAQTFRDAVSELVRLERLDTLINTPELEDFHRGVDLEAAHQVERFGAAHDAGKSPLDWFWLIGFLAQKAAFAAIAGDLDKARHHCVSTAAAMLNWHRALSGNPTAMRPGIETPAGEGAP